MRTQTKSEKAENDSHSRICYISVPMPILRSRASMTGNTVHLLTWRLLDYDTHELTYGGQQRWVLALADLLADMGCEVLVHQRSRCAFEKTLRPGLAVRGWPGALGFAGAPAFNLKVHRYFPRDAPVIYLIDNLAFPICRQHRSVMIQHGIWWDGPLSPMRRRIAEMVTRFSVRRCAATICVDTNYINWYRARYGDWSVDARLHFVPNFVDTERWAQPAEPAARGGSDGRLTICFPRRSEPRRGIWLMAEVAPLIADYAPHVDFRFLVGSGYHTDAFRERLQANQLPSSRFSLDVLPFERMNEAYADAAITVIPTMFSEGTSLSAIEAMYFGSATVASWVGGLPNLIEHEFNGLLIAPSAEELLAAIRRLIDDEQLRLQLGRQAMAMTPQLYGLKRWRERLRPILTRALQLDMASSPA